MFYRYPINDAHIHLFDPKDMDECIAMVDECGYTNWTFLACTVIDSPFALTQNLLCALMKLRENGRCQAFASFLDGIKMLDGKPGVRLRQNLPLDAPNYDKMFDYAQRTQFPILYHINDPIEFWYRDRLPQWAVEKDFFYGDGRFPHKFQIDEETFGFLRKHPNLNLCIPHFFFISDQPGQLLPRSGQLAADGGGIPVQQTGDLLRPEALVVVQNHHRAQLFAQIAHRLPQLLAGGGGRGRLLLRQGVKGNHPLSLAQDGIALVGQDTKQPRPEPASVPKGGQLLLCD